MAYLFTTRMFIKERISESRIYWWSVDHCGDGEQPLRHAAGLQVIDWKAGT
jgi:hypothetical protein